MNIQISPSNTPSHITEVMGLNPNEIFQAFFHHCSSSVHCCKDFFHIQSLSVVQMYDFHISTVVYSTSCCLIATKAHWSADKYATLNCDKHKLTVEDHLTCS